VQSEHTIQMYDLAGADDDRRISPFCWAIRMALAHKGLAVQTIPWRMVEKDKIASANSKTVPVIVDGEKTIGDSWAIAEYLDNAYPNNPLFESPQARAYCLWIHHWSARTLHALIVPIILEDVVRLLHQKDAAYFRTTRERMFGKPLEEVYDRSPSAFAKLTEALAPVRRALRHNAFLAGLQPAFGDYVVFGAFQWARCCSQEYLFRNVDDPLDSWFDRMLELYGGLGKRAKSDAPRSKWSATSPQSFLTSAK
jgi:glutathione S-transferase